MQPLLRILFTTLTVAAFAPVAVACCAGGTSNPLRYLDEHGESAHVYIARVDSSWMARGSEHFSAATVEEQLYGTGMPARITLHTGDSGLSTGGRSLVPGRHYLLYTGAPRGGLVYAFVCDYLSGALAGDHLAAVDPATLRAYFSALSGGGDATIRLEYRDGKPLAQGELAGGRRVGAWTYYTPSGDVEQRITYTRGGGGTPTRHTRTYGHTGREVRGSDLKLEREVWAWPDSTVERGYGYEGRASAKTRHPYRAAPAPLGPLDLVTTERGAHPREGWTETVVELAGGRQSPALNVTVERLRLDARGDTLAYARAYPHGTSREVGEGG